LDKFIAGNIHPNHIDRKKSLSYGGIGKNEPSEREEEVTEAGGKAGNFGIRGKK